MILLLKTSSVTLASACTELTLLRLFGAAGAVHRLSPGPRLSVCDFCHTSGGAAPDSGDELVLPREVAEGAEVTTRWWLLRENAVFSDLTDMAGDAPTFIDDGGESAVGVCGC